MPTGWGPQGKCGGHLGFDVVSRTRGGGECGDDGEHKV
jgi:hypothetical protein